MSRLREVVARSHPVAAEFEDVEGFVDEDGVDGLVEVGDDLGHAGGVLVAGLLQFDR